MSNKLSIWIGIISSAVTILLTVFNFMLNKEIQKTELELKRVETELKQKSFELDVSREKTDRYEFVYKVLPDLINNDKEHVVLVTNLIALALTDEEAQKLFMGLSNSEDKNIQNIGVAAIQSINKEKSNFISAEEFEKAGFEALINGDIDLAIQSFEAAEKVYPSYHQAYEIARLLRRNKDRLNEPETRRSVYLQIANELGWKAPTEYIIKLKEMSR